MKASIGSIVVGSAVIEFGYDRSGARFIEHINRFECRFLLEFARGG